MRLPSKITSYSESVISKFSLSSIEEFLDTLDCLYALHKVIYDADREVLCYVA